MAIRPATQIGDPAIRARSLVVASPSSPSAKKIVRDLVDSMRSNNLVGMAAPQIGVNKRIFVTEIRQTRTRNPKSEDPVRVFINPRIAAVSERQAIDYEGCGSVSYGGLFGAVRRPYSVKVTAYGLNGKKFTLRAEGLLARIIQHETDHLNGVVFLDRMKDMRSLIDRELLREV